jgi:tetratricopeptide (TPR) repeat protein
MSRGFYGLMLTWIGKLPEAEKNLLAAVAVAEREDRSASWMHANLVDFAWFTGRHEMALIEARKAYERAQAFGSKFFHALALRALGLAHCLHGEFDKAIELMEPGRVIVERGGLAYQFEANYLSVLCEAYRGAGRLEDAIHTGEEAITSARQSQSRVWEIRAWISFLNLPVTAALRPRAEEGLARVQSLIVQSGAVGFEPWLIRAQALWAADASLAAVLRAQAVEAFARMGVQAPA